MKLELSHLLALLAIANGYRKLGSDPTDAQYLALALSAIKTLTEAGFTFADLSAILEALVPMVAQA